LTDRIEWDLSSQLTPELFANQLVAELGLGGEAAPLIAHAIHEELIRHKKDCLERGLVGLAGKESNRGAKKMEGIWRDLHEAGDFGPKVEELTPEDIDRVEIDRERHSRRVRRDRDQINQGRSSRRR
jgi:chromatin structure-remodeling complex subunit SFH1